MAFFDIPKGFIHSIYVVGGELLQHSIASQAITNRSLNHSIVVAYSSIVPDRKISLTLSTTESLPNVFFGVVETNNSSFEFDNFDGEFTKFKNLLPYKSPVRVRRYDPINNEITTIVEQQISSFQVGKKVRINTSTLDITALDFTIPKNKIVDTSNPPPEGVNPNDITTSFADAPDNGKGIPVVFGKSVGVPCAAIKRDRENQIYDYLVCEDLATVDKVEKSSAGKWHKSFTSTGTVVEAGTTSDGRGYVLIPRTNPDSLEDDLFVGLYLSITNGKGALQTYEIEEHYSLDGSIKYQSAVHGITLPDPAPRIIILKENWVVTPDYFSEFQVQEYKEYSGNLYARRTAIEFLRAQEEDDVPKQIRADVIQYQPVRKNKLAWTDRADKFTSDVTYGWWQHLVGGRGHYDPNAYDPDAYITVITSGGGVASKFVSKEISAPYGSPIDKLGSVIVPGDGTVGGVCVQDTGIPGDGKDYVVSGWFLSGDENTYSVDVYLELSDGTSIATTTVNATPTIGSRFEFTGTAPVSAETIRVGFKSTTNVQMVVAPFALQCEVGTVATYPERVDYPGKGRVWSFPDAIKRLLTDPVYGGGQEISIDHASFEEANNKLWPLWLSCHGSLPDIEGGTGQALEVINELLQIRGMFLKTNGSAISIDVDDAAIASIQTVGIGDNISEDSLVSVEDIDFLDPTRLVKSLEVSYGLQYKTGTEEPIYQYLLKEQLQDVGTDKRELRLRFVRDHNTADRLLQYVGARVKLNSSTWRVTAGPVARAWKIKDVVTVVAPDYQIENLLVYNNNLSETGWTLSAGSLTTNAKFTPDYRTRLATKLAPGTIVYQDIAEDCDDRNVIVRLLVSSDSSSAIKVAIKDGTTEKAAQVITTGNNWQEVSLEYEYSGSVSPRIQLEVTGSSDVYVSKLQVCRDYTYGYVDTTDSAVLFDSQQTWQIVEIDRSDINEVAVSLVPYISSEIYSFTPNDYSQAVIAESSNDPTLTAPLPVVAVSLPASPALGIPTAQAGVDISNDNQVNSWAIITFLVPDDPLLSRIEVQLRKTGEPAWSTKATVTVSEVPINTVASILLQNLTPGLEYDIRFISYNTRGVSSGYQLTHSFIAYGDTTAPDAPTSVAPKQSTGKVIEVVVGFDPDPVSGRNRVASDYNTIRIYRAVTATSSAPADEEYVLHTEQPGFSYSDTRVDYLKYYWYKVTATDKSGNESTAFTVPFGVQVALIQGGVEIQDGSITADKLVAGSITTNNLTVGSYDNLIDNPGWELGDVTWDLPAGFTVVNNEAQRSGAYALRCTGDGVVLNDSKIYVAVGDPIYFEGHVFSYGSTTAQFRIGLVYYTADDTSIGGTVTDILTSGDYTAGFTKLVAKGTVPNTTQYMKAYIIVQAFDTGAIYFDDFFARKSVSSAELETLIVKGTDVIDGVDSIKIYRGTGSEIGFYDENETRLMFIDVHESLNSVSIGSGIFEGVNLGIGSKVGTTSARFETITVSSKTLWLTASSNMLMITDKLTVSLNQPLVLSNAAENDGFVLLGSAVVPGTANAKMFFKRGNTTYWVPMFQI